MENREYHDWTVDRIVVDTTSRSVVDCIDELLTELS